MLNDPLPNICPLSRLMYAKLSNLTLPEPPREFPTSQSIYNSDEYCIQTGRSWGRLTDGINVVGQSLGRARIEVDAFQGRSNSLVAVGSLALLDAQSLPPPRILSPYHEYIEAKKILKKHKIKKNQ